MPPMVPGSGSPPNPDPGAMASIIIGVVTCVLTVIQIALDYSRYHDTLKAQEEWVKDVRVFRLPRLQQREEEVLRKQNTHEEAWVRNVGGSQILQPKEPQPCLSSPSPWKGRGSILTGVPGAIDKCLDAIGVARESAMESAFPWLNRNFHQARARADKEVKELRSTLEGAQRTLEQAEQKVDLISTGRVSHHTATTSVGDAIH